MDFELSEEQKILKTVVSRFVDNQVIPLAPEIDEDGAFPAKNFETMADMGLFGISIPVEYGGSGADLLSCVLVMEQIARGCAATANTFGAHAILCTENLFRNGNETQRAKYLPDLISGRKIGAIAITEPGAGSDVVSMNTRAVKNGDTYILNGSKMFITNGPVTDVAIVYAKTDPPAGPQGITAFIVEKDFPGFSRGKALKKMGVKGSPTGELIFDNCEVPAQNVLVRENMGIQVLMNGLDRERIVYAILPIGVAQGAFDIAIKYAAQRVQFGKPIIRFQMIQEMIADMATSIQAGRLLGYWAAAAADKGGKVTLEASYAKAFGSNVGMQVVDKALQILGAYGYISEFPIERMYRDIKGIEIGAGTTQIQKLVICRELIKTIA